MNVFEETGNMEPQTIVLLDSTYEQYKKMWEDMICLIQNRSPSLTISMQNSGSF